MQQKYCGLVVTALLAASPFAHSAAAPAYPVKPVRIVVGFPAGSGTDMLARFIGGKFTDRIGQQVVVDNRPGANGIIAAELITKAPPDGYTLQFMSTSHTMNAAVYKLPFDPVKSFTPVMQLGSGPLVLVANPAFPATNAKGLIDIAAAKPNTVTYAVSGTGGVNHFAGALFSRITGTQLINVPYKGGPQALTDLIGGQVPGHVRHRGDHARASARRPAQSARRQHAQALAAAARCAHHRGVRRARLRNEHLVGRARAGRHAGRGRRQAVLRNCGNTAAA
jgi:tripartite-type tricarboxylate transporter receptor subunit TctC